MDQLQYEKGFLTNNPPPAEINPSQMINNAVNQGIQQEQRQYNVNQVAQQANNDVSTVMNAAQIMGLNPQQQQTLGQEAMTRTFRKGLLDGKRAYAVAMANGDEAGMKAAHDHNLAYQDLANQYGIDISGFGSGDSLAYSQARYNVDNASRYAQIADGLDSGTYYNQLYDSYIRQGMKPQYADQYASAKAAEYQSKRLGRLRDEFFANGIDINTGAFTDYGVQIVDMMRNENPDSITTIATMLPGPMQEYLYRTGERQKDNALGRALTMADINYMQKLGIMDRQQAQRMEMADKQFDQRMALAQYNASNRPIGGSSGSRSGNGSGVKLTGENAKGEKFVLDFFREMDDIQNNPKSFKDNPYDHRLAAAPKKIEKALNDGIIDSTMADTLSKVLAQTHNALWGAANVQANAIKQEDEEEYQ